MPKPRSVQHILIFGLALMLLGILAGCGSGGQAALGGDPGQSSPSADTPVEHRSPSTDASPSTDDGTETAQPTEPASLENEAFRVQQPAARAVVGMTFKLEGQSRTFEGVFHYTLEDGHNILAEGVIQAAAGAPEWGSFSTDVQLQEAPTSPHGVLVLYEPSAQDGSPMHELIIPLTFEESIVNYD